MSSVAPPRTPPPAGGQRLAKRVAEQWNCSRREAELYIEGGFVTVDGVMVDLPQFRVLNQRLELAPHARPEEAQPMTILLHKPPGFEAEDGRRPATQLLVPSARFAGDRATERPLRRHFAQQVCVTPLETGASGLLVFTQDFRIRRKLTEDAATVEHEVMVEVTGQVTPEALARLNRAPVVDGRAMPAAKVSVSRQAEAVTGLRFALKGGYPGQIAQMCDAVQLRVVGMKRLRVGRLPLSGLPLGQWRYLLPYERF